MWVFSIVTIYISGLACPISLSPELFTIPPYKTNPALYNLYKTVQISSCQKHTFAVNDLYYHNYVISTHVN